MKPKLAVLAVGSFLILASCDAFFSTNLFKEAGLGQPDAQELASMSTSELLDEAYTQDGSIASTFMEALEADTSARGEVLSTLEATYTSGTVSSATRQEAAALAVNVLTQTSGATDLVNGVVNAIADGIDFSMSTTAAITDFIESIVPAHILADESSFAAAINALLDADAARLAIDTTLVSDGLVGDLNAGDFAQNLIIAAALAGVVPTGGATTSEALWAAMSGDDSLIGSYAAPDLTSGSLNVLLAASGFDAADFGY